MTKEKKQEKLISIEKHKEDLKKTNEWWSEKLNGKKQNIYQKLVEVRKEVDYLEKEADGHKYKYTKESQILDAIRPKMDEFGVFLEIDMLSLEEFEFTKWHKDSKQFVIGKGLRAEFEFKWVNADDPSEVIAKKMIIQNDGIDAKSVGSLYTYANRYFLMKFFQIATDDLDPDTHQKRVESCQPKTQYVNEEQLVKIDLMLNGHDEIRETINKRFNSDLAKMTIAQYNLAKTWIENEITKKENSNV
jgi:hypothetical protein